MATETKGGGSGWLAFIAGALLVMVLALGFVIWSARTLHPAEGGMNLTIHTPNLPNTPAPQPVAPPTNVPPQ